MTVQYEHIPVFQCTRSTVLPNEVFIYCILVRSIYEERTNSDKVVLLHEYSTRYSSIVVGIVHA